MKIYIGRNAYNTPDQQFDYYGEAETRKDMNKLMLQYINGLNFISFYSRRICEKDENGNPMFIVDFGSYSRFFYIKELNDELLQEWQKISGGHNEQTE